MIIKIKTYQKVILILLVLLPAFFPYGSREYYLIPYSVKDPTGLIALCAIIYTVISLPYWNVVGMLFGLWVKDFRCAFLLGNLPIFINVVGEMIYFVILGMKQDTYPLLEYLIGSHIDKFNPLSIIGSDAIFLSLLLSTGSFLLVFAVGYYWGKSFSTIYKG